MDEKKTIINAFRGYPHGYQTARTQTLPLNHDIRAYELGEIRRRYAPPQTLGAPPEVTMAQDAALADGGYYNLLQHTFETVKQTLTPQFLGYGVLAGLMQNQVIRSGIEMLADEMTRKWIDLSRIGEIDTLANGDDEEEESDFIAALEKQLDGLENEKDDSADELIQSLEQELKKYNIARLFREAFALTGYLGGCLVYIDTLGDDFTEDELMSPLTFDLETFPKGALKGFKIIEPFNVSPGQYQSDNPLRSDYFKPRSWWVQGKEVHASRLLYFADNLPSTLLLPAYNFFGMPLAQLVLDSVSHFTSTRESTMRALKKYSLTVFKTSMGALEQPGALDSLLGRVQFLTDRRDLDGIELIDAESESIETVVSPIAGMSDIVRQAMDIVSASFNEPSVKLWGITPSGLNSTGEADLTNHYDNIASLQEAVFRTPLQTVLRILQWNMNGEIDDSIDFNFKPLGVMNEQTKAQILGQQAQRDVSYIQAGVISNEEVRARLATDPESGYSNIDVSDVPEQPQGGDGQGGDDQGGGMPDLAAMMGGQA